MHGLADQAEFHHRAIMLMKRASDVPPVVESSGLRPVTSAIALRNQIGERPRLGDEHAGIRRLPFERELDLAAGRLGGALLDQRLQRIRACAVVEADVEARPRLAGNEVDGLVADVDRGEFQMRRLEIASVPSSSGSACSAAISVDQPADRIVGALRIGDMALLAGDDQRAVERAAPADLDGVAERRDIARLAENAVVEFLAALGRPFQQLRACR